MYGLVNQAMEYMVCEHHGEETWERIKQHANVDIEMFLGMEVYPDEISFALFESACVVLHLSMDELLERFGRCWFTFTSLVGYDHLLALAGSSLEELLENLDTLHSCLVDGFPEIKAPTFTYDQVAPHEYHLHYHSERAGLAPMVIGLVKSLAENFGEEVEVSQLHARDAGHDHDVLRIRMLHREENRLP
jgi:hypothetical protein